MKLAIVQARMSSTRLPGKVLENLEGEPLIVRLLERVQKAKELDVVVVATSDRESDDPLVDLLSSRGLIVRRGSLNDVASRFSSVIDEFAPEHVVRLTGDNPLADPTVIDRVVQEHCESGADYTSNSRVRSYPYGLDVECFRADSFAVMCAGQLSAYDREHVTPLFYAEGSNFRVHQVVTTPDRSDLRWSVDYPEDLDFARAVYHELYPQKPEFDWLDVIALINERPELARMVGDVP